MTVIHPDLAVSPLTNRHCEEERRSNPPDVVSKIWLVIKGYVYIITNKNNSVLYTGVTSDLTERVKHHKEKKYSNSFSARYNLCKLVYYEALDTIGDAIRREKQIKAGSRKAKIGLIEGLNPEWGDLSYPALP
jgi:putative endonuclease